MKRTDWRERRARIDATARITQERVRSINRTIKSKGAQFFDHDLGSALGTSPAWEILSPFRTGSNVETTGARDMTKPFGLPE